MKTKRTIFTLIAVLLLVACYALTACNPPETDPPGHICRHLCSECNKCSDKTCLDPECADKCDGHNSTGGGDTGGGETPSDTDITSPFNGAILHKGSTTVGELYLEGGYGNLTISNPNAEFSGNFVECTITYTLLNDEFKIWTASDSTITTPIVGTVQGRTVSITIEKDFNGVKSSYEFRSQLNKITLKNQLGKNETNVWYLPEGYKEDIRASRSGYNLDKVIVNGVEKPSSWLNGFVTPAQDTTIEYVWTQIEQTGNYTVIYQAANDTGETYTDYSTSSIYTLKSIYGTEEEQSELGFTVPTGKFFAGWLINGTTKASNNQTITLTEETTIVVAQWSSYITVRLEGLNESGVSSNLSMAGWTGSNSQGYTQDFTTSYNFFLPKGFAKVGVLWYVERSGFVLKGWKCSVHGEMHLPNAKHELAEDVTFTAEWERDTGISIFNGVYEASEPLYVSLTGVSFAKVEIVGSTFLFYTVDGDPYQKAQRFDMDGDTAEGAIGSLTVTFTIDGDTLTVSITSGVNKTVVGTFVRVS